MAEPFLIRPMTPGDIEAVMAIANQHPQAPHWPRSSYEAIFAPGSYPERTGLIAESASDGVAGFVVAAIISPQAEIESIAVTSRFQRIGLARRLVGRLSDELRGRNCMEILLEVRESNHPARRLYSSLGFTETARRPGYYTAPVEDAILMGRSLI
jgi:ribosomal-protein-alanine N-acetyltransferase